MSTPLNPTGAFTGLGGNFNIGAGYNLDKKNTIFGEFMWNNLPGGIVDECPACPRPAREYQSLLSDSKLEASRGQHPWVSLGAL